MKANTLLKTIVPVLILPACTTWTPTVDPYKDPYAYRIQQDMNECGRLAHQASGEPLNETVKGAAVGGLIGAAGGAALGAISGDPGTGAAIGATIGGFGGGVKEGFGAEERYKRTYINCLHRRGHYVVDR